MKQHYQAIISKNIEALDNLCNDQNSLAVFTSIHNHSKNLDLIKTLTKGRPEEEIYKLALVEFQHGLHLAAFAQYRQAHVSLRLFLELSLTTVLFSAHEINCRLWLNGQKDLNWSSITSKENGIFSKEFTKIFFEGMQDHSSQYCTMAETLYRECSEFVHGNKQSYDGLDSTIRYSADILTQWAERAETAVRVVLFAFFCRYLNLTTQEIKNNLELMALEEFSDLAPIQGIYSEVKT